MMQLTIALFALLGSLSSVSWRRSRNPPRRAAPEKPNAELAPPVPQARPLTVREKYFYTVNRSFGAQPLLIAVAGAGGDASCRASCL